MDEYEDFEEYDDESPVIQNKSKANGTKYDEYPHLFLNLGNQKMYTPFLFYTIMIIFMGLMVFNYSVA